MNVLSHFSVTNGTTSLSSAIRVPFHVIAINLSQQGCYVDTNKPLPLGTVTDVRITKGTQLFKAHARVVYSRANKSMGLVFTDVFPKRLRSSSSRAY